MSEGEMLIFQERLCVCVWGGVKPEGFQENCKNACVLPTNLNFEIQKKELY